MFLSMISADNATLYSCGKDLDTISNKLELETNTALQQLKDNEMVANSSKFQFMFLSKCKKTYLLMEKPLHHQIQLNYLELLYIKILILNGTYKIFVTK